MTERYICIHGHFYQPPRENPWLESIELQDSAYPYHDWNERITAECYGPNGASRILDGRDRIVRIVNNYARISYNFGPTLLAWLEEKAPDIYARIIDADRESKDYFSGHGSAIAQVYNHNILPLANLRDKESQVIWGIRDFERRFQRKPAGMWLAETAVDTESLEVLAENGIKYTLLSPYQAAGVRRINEPEWLDVIGGAVDPRRPYLCRLPSGRNIVVFYYDGPISRAVAFEKLLTRGEYLAERLLGAFRQDSEEPQLVHIATDGETYGHHHRHGDMALAYALQYIQEKGVRLTNYAEFLEKHPPLWETRIIERTAWSCAHGVGRWAEDCGCSTGGNVGWHQAWRQPLRASLDWLRDRTAPLYEEAAGELMKDPWSARNDYIDVILNRDPKQVEEFFNRHAKHVLSPDELVRALKLLELQRQNLLMYTSCGWFFDELSGIETIQVLQYAGRAIQLGEEAFNIPLEEDFLAQLEKAPSNVYRYGNGRRIYERFVKPAISNLEKVGAHYAMSSLWKEYAEQDHVYCYWAGRERFQTATAGRAKLALGRVRITSIITYETELLTFGVLHFGDHNLIGGVRPHRGESEYETMSGDVLESFSRADFPETIRRLDRHFGSLIYSLKSLFSDEQRKIVSQILNITLEEAETSYRQLYENHAPLMRFLGDLRIPLPKALKTAGEFVVNSDLRNTFASEKPDIDEIRLLLDEAHTWEIELDATSLAYTFGRTIQRCAEGFYAVPHDLEPLTHLRELVDLALALPFEIDFSRVQDRFYSLLQSTYPEWRARAEAGEAEARRWVDNFRHLGERLSFSME